MSEPPRRPAPLRCDFCGAEVPSVRRVALDAGYDRLKPHREQYEAGGVGYQVAGGIDVHLTGWLSALADYKYGRGSPEVMIVDGTGRTTANLHQFAFGLAFGLSR